MGERTGYAHGVPSWVDLATTDTEAAKSFYVTLFGWDADDVPTGEEAGTYTMFSKDGRVVAGMGQLPDDAGMPPVWHTYIAVDDIDAVIDKATAAGGSVIMPATDVMDTGRMAYIADPTGGAVGLWQAGTHKGAQLVNQDGTYTWSELLTDDTAAAERFYADVFGYQTEATEMPTGTYTTFWADGNLEGHAAAGMMARTPDMGSFPNYWGVYFAVDDADASAATAEESGGKVLAPPFDVPSVGRMSVISDPQGAVFTVMQYETPIP